MRATERGTATELLPPPLPLLPGEVTIKIEEGRASEEKEALKAG